MSSTIKFFFLGIIALTKNDLFASDIQNTDQEKISQNKENELITLLKKYTKIGKNFKEEEKKEEYETYKEQYLEASKNNKEYYKLLNKTSEENKDVQTNNDIKNEKIQTNNEIKNENKQEKPHDYDYFCENEKIIEMDLHRTFPEIPGFNDDEMQNKLRNVLNSLYFYKEKIKYIQGFNCIVGGILICCEEEYVAFWFFIALYEEKGLKENYYMLEQKGVGSLSFHFNVIREYFFKTQKVPEKYKQPLRVFWFWNLLCCQPMLKLCLDKLKTPEEMLYIFEKIFTEGFYLIYKICIATMQKTLSDIHTTGKDLTYENFAEIYQKNQEEIPKNIIDKAQNIEVEKKIINEAQNIEVEKEDKEKFDSFYEKFCQKYKEKQKLFYKIRKATISVEEKNNLTSKIELLLLEDPNDLKEYNRIKKQVDPNFLQRVSSFCTHLC